MKDFINRNLSSYNLQIGEQPPFASLEFSINALCNRRCKFCPRVDEKIFKNENKHLSFSAFKKLIDELSNNDYSGRISFSGFCEPLMTKNLEEYIQYGREECPDMTIELVTNGDLLDESRVVSLFSAGLNNIRISLYDGPEQILKFNSIAQKMGYDEKKVILRERYLTAEESFGLTISNRGGSLILKDGPLDIKPLENPLSQPCYYPFYKMLVEYDGNVLICSNDWLKWLIVGNINKDNIFDIWDSEKFTLLRKKMITSDRHILPCRYCDVNGLYNGEYHFEAWKQYYSRQNS